MRKLMIGSALCAILVLAGVAYAAVSAVTARPTVKSVPELTGVARDGDTLTAKEGEWVRAGPSAVSFAYQWQRCDVNGANCANIPSGTGKTYLVQTADVSRKLRVFVAATDSDGTSQAVSKTTGVVAPRGGEPDVHPAGAIKLPDGAWSIPASSIALPDRLVISQVQFSPPVIRSRTPFQGRFRITTTSGYVVRDALVYVTGVPWSRILQPAEVKSAQDGWAQVQIQPTERLTLRNGYFIVMFVRARKEGEKLLAGVSTRRLVQLKTANPAR
jgi:hypothetical protein